MDGSAEDEVTRPPEERDLIALARELNRLGVRYVVIGGLAINRLGYVRATDDIDLLIARDLANQQRAGQRSLFFGAQAAIRRLRATRGRATDFPGRRIGQKCLTQRPSKSAPERFMLRRRQRWLAATI